MTTTLTTEAPTSAATPTDAALSLPEWATVLCGDGIDCGHTSHVPDWTAPELTAAAEKARQLRLPAPTECMVMQSDTGYRCTRPAGHYGDHAAADAAADWIIGHWRNTELRTIWTVISYDPARPTDLDPSCLPVGDVTAPLWGRTGTLQEAVDNAIHWEMQWMKNGGEDHYAGAWTAFEVIIPAAWPCWAAAGVLAGQWPQITPHRVFCRAEYATPFPA